MSTVKCVGILTSGGDAPGMNAAIRAVTRSAIYNGMRVKGIYRGYKGLILDEIEEFKTQNVSNIIQRGGTILKTARCVEFKTPEGRKQAYDKFYHNPAVEGMLEQTEKQVLNNEISSFVAAKRMIDLFLDHIATK